MRAFKTAVIRRLVNPPFLLLTLCLQTFFLSGLNGHVFQVTKILKKKRGKSDC